MDRKPPKDRKTLKNVGNHQKTQENTKKCQKTPKKLHLYNRILSWERIAHIYDFCHLYKSNRSNDDINRLTRNICLQNNMKNHCQSVCLRKPANQSPLKHFRP